MSNQTNTAPAPVQVPKRFSVLQRIEHIVLIVSFTTLGLTGLAQKFSSNELAAAFIQLLGGIENVRIIHRVAATILALETIYHIIVLAYKTYVRRTELGMLPGPKDVLDALDVLRYNLGLTKAHPKLPRYNFAEKAEYWAMLWGTAVMGLTGFILWNPIVAAKILPGQFIPAAKAAHGGEAVLAVLAILVWHFYNVHLKSLNKAMFTGQDDAPPDGGGTRRGVGTAGCRQGASRSQPGRHAPSRTHLHTVRGRRHAGDGLRRVLGRDGGDHGGRDRSQVGECSAGLRAGDTIPQPGAIGHA